MSKSETNSKKKQPEDDTNEMRRRRRRRSNHPNERKLSSSQSTSQSSNNDKVEETTTMVDERSTRRRNRLRNEVASLHREMEIAEYMVNHQGRSRRRLATHLRKSRTKKRKALEADDEERHAMAVVETTEKKKRLRGSKIAFEDEVVKGSMIFGQTNNDDTTTNNNNDNNKEDNGNNHNNNETDQEYLKQQNDDEDAFTDDDDNDDDNNNDDDGMEDEDYEEDEESFNDDDDDNQHEDDGSDGKNDKTDSGRYEMYADELDLSDQELYYMDYNAESTKTTMMRNDNDGMDAHDKEEGSNNSNAKKLPRNRRDKLSSSQPNPSQAAKLSAVAGMGKQKLSARLMYRLKNFKSHRLAQKHGVALGQFARGCHKTAVHKLSQVADAAPIAPQVYSSLGLVYENLLLKQTKEGIPLKSNNNTQQQQQEKDNSNETLKNNVNNQETATADDDSTPKKNNQHKEKNNEGEQNTFMDTPEHIHLRMNLARKAYGSYHVAALLCKKDFTLWVRAADCAMEMADLHALSMTSTMLLLNEEQLNKHREERKKWLEEAKDDYTAADNLHPPGITVPAKLANVQMELGNLSEALTILTDLKNNQTATLASMYNKTNKSGKEKAIKSQRTELERSYTAWLLYADLMLRIGHECNKWNQNILDNDNYMFRRWLRKYSNTFDWKERRLQALCLALEAAAGTKSCSRLIEWTRDRAVMVRSADGQSKNVVMKGDFQMMNRGAMHNQRWQVDSYEADQKAAQEKAEAERKARNEKDRQAKAKANDQKDNKTDQTNQKESPDNNEEKDTHEDDMNKQPEENKKEQEGLERVPLYNSSTLNPGDFQDELDRNFQNDRKLMISSHRAKLAQYDAETKEMNLVEKSHAALTRAANRLKLVKKQKLDVVKLVGDYHAQKLAQKKNSSLLLNSNQSMEEGEQDLGEDPSFDRDESNTVGKSNVQTKPLPISGSCSSVCFIASQLMRQCLSLELYHGGRLVAEAVSSYFIERASKFTEKREKVLNVQNRLKSNFMDPMQLAKEEYDDVSFSSNILVVFFVQLKKPIHQQYLFAIFSCSIYTITESDQQ